MSIFQVDLIVYFGKILHGAVISAPMADLQTLQLHCKCVLTVTTPITDNV